MNGITAVALQVSLETNGRNKAAKGLPDGVTKILPRLVVDRAHVCLPIEAQLDLQRTENIFGTFALEWRAAGILRREMITQFGVKYSKSRKIRTSSSDRCTVELTDCGFAGLHAVAGLALSSTAANHGAPTMLPLTRAHAYEPGIGLLRPFTLALAFETGV